MPDSVPCFLKAAEPEKGLALEIQEGLLVDDFGRRSIAAAEDEGEFAGYCDIVFGQFVI
jgi:hypothetical protein